MFYGDTQIISGLISLVLLGLLLLVREPVALSSA